MIAIEGQLQSRSWDTQDGKRQYATEVIVDNVSFTGEKPQTENTDGFTYLPDDDTPF